MLIIFMYFEIFIINKLKTFLFFSFKDLIPSTLCWLFTGFIYFLNFVCQFFLGKGSLQALGFALRVDKCSKSFLVPIDVRSSIYSHCSPFRDFNVSLHNLLNVMPHNCLCIVTLQILGRDLFLSRFSGLMTARDFNTVYRVPLYNIVCKKVIPSTCYAQYAFLLCHCLQYFPLGD